MTGMPSGGQKTALTGLSMSFSGTFQPGGLFSPGTPPIPTSGPQWVRQFDFPVGSNLQFTPRAYEPFSFASLRSFANVELVRLAIETRKDQIERLDWQVRPRNGRRPRGDSADRVRAAEKFLRRPDGVTHFSTWLRMLLEDLLVLDAPAIERRRSFGGKLIGLDIVDGATIKLLIDDTGRRPLPPAPAYQQVIKGRIWSDLTMDDLIYAPRNMRSGHLYGFGPVEQTIVTINTILRRQTQQLAYFTDGNVPQGLVNAPEGWTVDQLKQWQEWFDAKLSGNAAERSKLLWGPAGAKYQSFKDAPIKDEFDEWLARVVCFAFSLPPTPFIKSMNRATSDSESERAHEEGLAPLKLWAKRLMDTIIQDDLGFPELEFSWISAEDVDPKVQTEIHDTRLAKGVMSIDEVREDIGLDPLPGGIGAKPMIYMSSAVALLETVLSGGAQEVGVKESKTESEVTRDVKDDQTDAAIDQ